MDHYTKLLKQMGDEGLLTQELVSHLWAAIQWIVQEHQDVPVEVTQNILLQAPMHRARVGYIAEALRHRWKTEECWVKDAVADARRRIHEKRYGDPDATGALVPVMKGDKKDFTKGQLSDKLAESVARKDPRYQERCAASKRFEYYFEQIDELREAINMYSSNSGQWSNNFRQINRG